LRDGELSASLAEREVQLSVWSEGGALLLQPARFLGADTRYTLAALGVGELAALHVAAEPFWLLHHVWPEAVAPGGNAVYCADEDADESVGWPQRHSMALGPSGALADVLEGVGPDAVEAARCSTVVVPAELSEEFVLPPLAGHVETQADAPEVDASARSEPLFDPRPLALVHGALPAPVASAECKTTLGPACASFVGTELLLEGAPSGAWSLRAKNEDSGASVEYFEVFRVGSRVAFHGFDAGVSYAISATYFDAWGRTHHASVQLASGAPRARFVLNEVLANPLGAEPDSEWIEVVNVGLAAGSLQGLALEDSGGSALLPDVELGPGQFGVIVGSSYSAIGADVVPHRAAVPIVVERVGKGGLANSGEPVRLVSATGDVLSFVPALAASRQGVSWARRDVWAPDVPESFGEHAAPGASPGAENVLAE
jgi:hypothetical protein